MFTGIIEAIGTIGQIQQRGGDIRLGIDAGKLDMSDVRSGDSIAINGVCLTVINPQENHFNADVSNETLSLSSLGALKRRSLVNLEKALTLSKPLGGHMVSGHVDGLGVIKECLEDGRSIRLLIEAPAALAKYIARKGSITVDGTSLTVNSVDGALFELNIIPHTLKETIIGNYQEGTKVNLEVDLIARYLERLLLGEKAAHTGVKTDLDLSFLQRAGFID